MSSTSAADRFRLELSERLERRGFVTFQPADPESQEPIRTPDLLAGNDGTLYLFVVKSGENPQTVPAGSIDHLQQCARDIGGKPRIAVRRYGTDWRFLFVDELRDQGDTYEIRALDRTGYGVSIDEL